MKNKLTHHLLPALLGFALTTNLHAQTSAFTYQGRLTDNGVPANGMYDLRFTIYDLDVGGTEVAGPITSSPVNVSNGLFTVALDFGSGVFDGSERWLEIGVLTNGPAPAEFNMLSPRQLITSAPYAIKAADAMMVNLGTISDPSFFGTTSNTPLQLQVNNTVGLQLEYPTIGTVPNLVVGNSGNSVSAGSQGAVIGGGGTAFGPNTIGLNSSYTVGGGGEQNSIAANSDYATIAGRLANHISVGSFEL